MKSIRLLDRRLGYLFGSVGLLLSVALSAFPTLAFAATSAATSRSIQMSSSASGATGVSYQLQFTANNDVAVGGGIILDFCSDSPLIGLACSATGDVDVSSATLGAVTYDNGTALSGTAAGSITKTNSPVPHIVWTAGTAYTAGQVINITLDGITNPTLGTDVESTTIYGRITTYANSTDLATYTSVTSVGTVADEGAVALGITKAIGITAYVREALTFCVANIAPTASCTGINDTNNPSMTLGEDIGGGQKALDSTKLSTGEDYAQLSTNASSGAIVNLHTSTSCGGLQRVGATGCDIAAQNATATTIAAGQAEFGLTLGTTSIAQVAGGGSAAETSGSLAPAGNYGPTDYYLDYNSGDPTQGVTSPYGSALFNSAGAPVSNVNIPITFAASTANDTPAGIYSASLNLIATGTF